jgi:hypothetical protein
MKQEIATEGMKSAPPVAVTAASVVQGVTLNEWVAIATIIYIALQAGYLVWKWFKEFRATGT